MFKGFSGEGGGVLELKEFVEVRPDFKEGDLH